jgi:hypothetical protein
MGKALFVLLPSREGFCVPGDSIHIKEHQDSCARTNSSATGIVIRKF